MKKTFIVEIEAQNDEPEAREEIDRQIKTYCAIRNNAIPQFNNTVFTYKLIGEKGGEA